MDLIEIKIIVKDEFKVLPGVSEWVKEIEEVFNSKESMKTLNTALAIIAGSAVLESFEKRM